MNETRNDSAAAASDDARAVPAKCVACARELHTPVVCDYCHSLNPISGPTDHFTLLGVPRRFEVDQAQLRSRYLALNRHAHPDFHSNDNPAVRELSLTVAAAVNDAYRTLSDPFTRGEYLLALLGGRPSAEDKSTPDGFLAEMAEIQEKLYTARAERDQQTMRRTAAELTDRFERRIARLGEMFGGFDTQVGCEAVRQSELDRIRKELNAISYVRRLLAVARGR